MKRSHLVFLIIFFVSLAGLWLWQFKTSEANLVLKGERLNVMLARTPDEQYQGLGGRDNLGEYDGMLFVFPYSHRVGIMMRDMRFPIDIVWFEQGAVVDIAPHVPLEPGVADADLRVYLPRTNANVVLELSAGWAGAHNLKLGDRLRLIEE